MPLPTEQSRSTVSDRMAQNERPGKLQIGAWFDLDQVAEIDRRVAELQLGRALKVHRSDVLRQIVEEWCKARQRENSE